MAGASCRTARGTAGRTTCAGYAELKTRSDLDQSSVVDVFTVHYYPQGGEFWPEGDVSTGDAAPPQPLHALALGSRLRGRDVDQRSCSADPRLRNLVNTHYYAGTPIGITEYNWGAKITSTAPRPRQTFTGSSGAKGLDIGRTMDNAPATSTPTYKAMKLYRNYDGNGSGFGDTSVRAISTANADNLSVFAADRSSDGAPHGHGYCQVADWLHAGRR